MSILTKASCSAMAVPTVMEAEVTVSPAGRDMEESPFIQVAESRTSTTASASPPLKVVTLMDEASGTRRSIAIIRKAGKRRGAFAFISTPMLSRCQASLKESPWRCSFGP